MDRLAFVAVTAIAAQTNIRQNLAHGTANVNTTGFKQSFATAVSESIRAEGAGLSTRINFSNIPSDIIDLGGGSAVFTGQKLDVAFNGRTVLSVTAPDGSLAFTRRGDLKINSTGALQTGGGHLVRSENGGALTIPIGVEVSIKEDGSVYGTDQAQVGVAQPVLIGKISIREATSQVLERRVDGLFQVQGKPGADIQAGAIAPSLSPETLESSNVNPVEYMVRLMDNARTFEHYINLVKSAKENDQSGTSMMKAN